jgi:Zn-dependent M32 family carboxypeptidase
VRHLSRWASDSSGLARDKLPFDRQPDRLELAIKQATALLAEHMREVVQQDQAAALRWHNREVERENRIYEKRHAAAQVELGNAHAQWESKKKSSDPGDQQILPALFGKAERAAQRVHSIEQAHQEALNQLQERVELLPAFEILAASLIRVICRTRGGATRPR